MTPMMRYGLVFPRAVQTITELEKTVQAYLPSNYTVLWSGEEGVVVRGRDNAGWTLDGYVIPRLGSGLMRCEEIDLSHPVTQKIPA